jgi:MFS family permease
MVHLIAGAALFGVGLALAAFMPTYLLFAIPLVLVGFASQTFTTGANSTLQLSSEPAMRGRVVSLFLAIALGGTPLGAPIVGWVADRRGPRWALGVGGAAGLSAALVGIHYLAKYQRLRLHVRAGRLRFTFDSPHPEWSPT